MLYFSMGHILLYRENVVAGTEIFRCKNPLGKKIPATWAGNDW